MANESSEEGGSTKPSGDTSTPHVDVNELLAYYCHYSKNSSADVICTAILEFYTPEEIHDARALVWERYVTTGLVGDGWTKSRKGGKKAGAAHVLELSDIKDVLKYIDENPVQKATSFVAVNLDRIPRCTPEHIEITSLVERVRTMERKYAKLEADVAENGIRVVANSGSIMKQARDINANSGTIQWLSSTVANSPMARGYANAAQGSNAPMSQKSGSSPESPHSHAAGVQQLSQTSASMPAALWGEACNGLGRASDGDGNGRRDGNGRNGDVNGRRDGDVNGRRDGDGNGRRDGNAHNGNAESLGLDRDDAGSDTSWVRQRHRGPRRRHKAVFGSGSVDRTTLTASKRSIDLFVFNAETHITVDNLRQYINDTSAEIGRGVTVMGDIKKISKEEARTNSFVVSVSEEDSARLLNSDFWPEGIGIRRFWPKRR